MDNTKQEKLSPSHFYSGRPFPEFPPISPIPLPDQDAFNPQSLRPSSAYKYQNGNIKCPSPPTKTKSPNIPASLYTPTAQPIDISSQYLDMDMNVPSPKRGESNYFEVEFPNSTLIGNGSFAEVYRVVSRTTGRPFAVKKWKKPYISQKAKREALKEFLNSKAIPAHPHLLRYYSAWEEQGFLYILTELCSKSLTDFRGSLQRPFLESEIWSYILDLALGLDHIHQHSYLHLDIKPENILVSDEGMLKIGDFGLMTRISDRRFDMEGDGRYLAPEVLDFGGQAKSPAVDIYAFGATIFELTFDALIPEDRSNFWNIIEDAEVWRTYQLQDQGSGVVKTRSGPLMSLIRQMMRRDPSDRIDLDSILNHNNLQELLRRRSEKYKDQLRAAKEATTIEVPIFSMDESLEKNSPESEHGSYNNSLDMEEDDITMGSSKKTPKMNLMMKFSGSMDPIGPLDLDSDMEVV